MKSSALSLLLVTLSLLSSSCIRTSTTVSVKKGGSGTIEADYRLSPQLVAMADRLGALGGSLGGEGGAPGGADLGRIKKMTEPDEAALRADAAGFGEGVRYQSHSTKKDSDGWTGYQVVYEFDDIRKVRLDRNSIPGQAKEMAKSAGGDLEKAEGSAITFDLEDDLLTVKTRFSQEGMSGIVGKDKLEEARKTGAKPSDSIRMAAGLVQGMEVSLQLRAVDGIAETDAAHVEGDLIVLTRADLGKVLKDPDFGAFLDKVVVDPAAATPEAQEELAGKLEGLTIETKDQFKVKLK